MSGTNAAVLHSNEPLDDDKVGIRRESSSSHSSGSSRSHHSSSSGGEDEIRDVDQQDGLERCSTKHSAMGTGDLGVIFKEFEEIPGGVKFRYAFDKNCDIEATSMEATYSGSTEIYEKYGLVDVQIEPYENAQVVRENPELWASFLQQPGVAMVPAIVIRRHYAEAHFPDSKVEALEHSQIWKVSEAIREDHKQLKDYYNHVVNSKDLDEQERYGNAFVWELARHSIAEEIVVYPAFERDIQDGRSIADQDRAQHQNISIQTDIKEQLYRFQKLKPKDEAYLPVLKELFGDLEQHIKKEEQHDLVELEKRLSLTESKELTPFETVAGLMAAPIDKLRDLLFTKFPEKKMPKIGHTGHGVGESDR
ncbi:hypothetical protein NUW58_g441 [Xylaria curta]|uniref:Uncharacterized protein n=1 Tax=Xylaria curta TaxID=42375 RepID=A0ACC1PPC5_9PEZI|nr:hypothetical protein NUW58_g441 [Xylaria curta]